MDVAGQERETERNMCAYLAPQSQSSHISRVAHSEPQRFGSIEESGDD